MEAALVSPGHAPWYPKRLGPKDSKSVKTDLVVFICFFIIVPSIFGMIQILADTFFKWQVANHQSDKKMFGKTVVLRVFYTALPCAIALLPASLYASHPINWPNAGTLTDWEADVSQVDIKRRRFIFGV